MKQYVDYEYYSEAFKGTMPQVAFESIVVKASAFIRHITFNRICEPISEDVKDAVCAVSDVIFRDEQYLAETGGKDIRSENNDGYTVTYAAEGKDGMTHEEILEKKMYQAARMYLGHTGLLYLGV